MELILLETSSSHRKEEEVTGSFQHRFTNGKSCAVCVPSFFCDEVTVSVEAVGVIYFDFNKALVTTFHSFLRTKSMQDPALDFVEPHEIHMGPLLEPDKVPLDGIPSLRCVNHRTHPGFTCKFAESALDPTVYVIDEDIEQYWSQYGSLRDSTCHQFPSGH
ncbi:serine-rich hypothetical protein [Limosa lapponica baueri]|uniref:Uncharacterized protein n=1 Tax=Limosa lapponica baueri TaxID=1758121 RepID=A0A2I0UJP0_LIMLA|nr:serine-rich hypothetical protein [Limosa lapponica baueri]